MDRIPKSRFDVSEFFNSPRQVPNEKPLRLNEWIDVVNANRDYDFRYNIPWNYADKLNPVMDTVDVHARFPVSEEKSFTGTFVTPAELDRWFERFKGNGDYANGTYIPLHEKLLVERISNDVVERTIADLIKEDRFFQYFTRD